MNSKPTLTELRHQLKNLENFSVVIYGSYASANFTSRSDIDIAIVTMKSDPAENKKRWQNMLGRVPDKFDLKVFELLPLEIKASIIQNHQVLFGNHLEISEYFYHFRKLWEDVKPRFMANQFTNLQEKLKALDLV